MANNPNKSGAAILIVILILIIIAIGSCSGKQDQAAETQKFQDQMNQDPATWNKEQKDRYNDFMDWTEKQQEKENNTN